MIKRTAANAAVLFICWCTIVGAIHESPAEAGMTTRVNERDPPQITTSLRGAKRRGNPVVHRTSRKIDGIATGLSALAMTW